MVKINIFTENSSREEFLHELDLQRFPLDEYYIKENSLENMNWDMVVVYEGLCKPVTVHCKEGNVVFISGEPPMSRVYPKAFLAQFSTLITQRPNLKHPDNRQYHPCMNWHLSLSYKMNRYLDNYADFVAMKPFVKSRNLSMITSSKRMMPGHGKRMNFVKALKMQLGSDVDLFGQGLKFVDAKTEAINDYRFTISVENSQIPNYWTEKFADPILAFTIPFYCGCTNITNYFPIDSYIPIDINDKGKAIEKIKEILKNPEQEYQKRLPALLEARKKILEEYNIFAELHRMFGSQIAEDRAIKEYTIAPSSTFPSYKYLHYKLRLQRLLAKIYISYFK